MSKLLWAGLYRLRLNKTFWLCMGSMLVYSVLYMQSGYRTAAQDPTAHQYSLDLYYFHFALPISLYCAVLASMFLGTEYHDGTIRNKIAAGCTRTDIYLSSFLLTFLGTLFITAAWLLGALTGIFGLGLWKMDAGHLLLYLLIAVMFISAFSVVYTFIAMLYANKAGTVVFTMLLCLGLLLGASLIYNTLEQPEMLSDVIITSQGMQMGEALPNPHYVSGAMRDIYQRILEFLPSGQGLLLWQLEISHPLWMLASSLLIIAAANLGGILLFKRKNIK